MDKVLVETSRLKAKLLENKERHVETYEKAVEAYRHDLRAYLKRKANELEHGMADIDLHRFPKPVSYAHEYDEALAMLEWETDHTISLSHSDFKQLVLDQWNWAHQFNLVSSTYVR